MSNEVLPTLPGMVFRNRAPYAEVDIYPSVSGREVANTYWASFRHKFTIDIELLRGNGGYTEFQQWVTTYARRFGLYDNFLIQDQDDCVVTDCCTGLGNGTTTQFQLQRALSGLTTDTLGSYNNGTKPRTNLCLQSQALATSPWSTSNAGAANNIALAPNGTATASYITDSIANVQHYALQSGFGLVAGNTYTASIYAKGAGNTSLKFGWNDTSGCSVFDLSAGTVSSLGTTAASIVPAGAGWYRVTIQYTATSSSSGQLLIMLGGGTAYVGNTTGIYAWGCQVETGTIATQYIATTTVAITSLPTMWPGIGSGFEPVYDVRQALPSEVSTDTTYDGSPTIWLDGDWQLKRRLYQTARTNLCTFSEQIDNAAWNKGSGSATANVDVAPDGTTTADRYAEDGTSNFHNLSTPFQGATVGRIYCFSSFLKAGSKGTAWLAHYNGSTWYIAVNLTTGTIVGAGSGLISSGMQYYGNGWYRVWMSCQAQINTQAWFIGNGNSSTGPYTGTSGAYNSVWGTQIEVDRTSPTSYIKTPSSSAVTVTDITSVVSGLVTLSSAPTSGAVLSWTGGYYKRVRFDNPNGLSMDRLIPYWWASKSIPLITVKPTA